MGRQTPALQFATPFYQNHVHNAYELVSKQAKYNTVQSRACRILRHQNLEQAFNAV
jgi:hypothetical protein